MKHHAILVAFTQLFTFKRKVTDLAIPEQKSQARWSIAGDALKRAASELEHNAEVINTELLIVDDDITHAQLSKAVSLLRDMHHKINRFRTETEAITAGRNHHA